jgi:CubicO group peptidase (beta-lactamase class C family)
MVKLRWPRRVRPGEVRPEDVRPESPALQGATAAEVKEWLAAELPGLIERFHVPGAQAGVLVDGEIADAASGILHLGTGVAADTDALFQIGSITKVWTATLVMQLVDEGRIDLDVPVRTYLPNFTIADESAAAAITTRHLLTHQAGFEGDLFTDTGRGDDCLEKFVATLVDTPQLFVPGTHWTYNNAGFVTLGRLIEVLRGKPFDQVLTEHLIQPLGLTHAAPGPYEAIMYKVAMGHVASGEEGKLVPAPLWSMVRSSIPAGSHLSMRVSDLLRFAKFHIDGGVAADGTRVLSADSVKAMQEPYVDVPDMGLLAQSWGLGWEVDETPVGRMVSHDGSTVGQNAFLRVIPELGIAVSLLTNGGDTQALARAVFDGVFERLTGAAVLRPLPNPADALPALHGDEAAKFIGTYESSVMKVTVWRDEEGVLWAKSELQGTMKGLVPDDPAERLAPVAGDGLIQVDGSAGIHVIYRFLDPDDNGRFTFLFNSRALPRTS